METQDKTETPIINRYIIDVAYIDGELATHYITATTHEEAVHKIWRRHLGTGKVRSIQPKEA